MLRRYQSRDAPDNEIAFPWVARLSGVELGLVIGWV